MSFGEMTITSDDVSALLHILVMGYLSALSSFIREEVVVVLADQLRVDEVEATDEVRTCKGVYVHYSWLDGVA